eukprot:PhM_4_TR13411/c0_g1_i1/m.81795/K17584/PCIF1; phosphorylated CTD-interacting factor 1
MSESGWVIYDTHKDRKLGRGDTTNTPVQANTIRPYLCREEWSGESMPTTVDDMVHVAVALPDRVQVDRFRAFYLHRFFKWLVASPVTRCAEMELQRGDTIATLRKYFFELLDARRITRPREAFNRWLFESRTQLEVGGDRTLLEPLIPCDPNHRSPSLMRELVKACKERSKMDDALTDLYANEVLDMMIRRAVDMTKALHNPVGGCPTSAVSVSVTDSVKVTIRCEGVSHDILPGHYQKLRRLFYNAHREGAGEVTDDHYHRRLFTMLQRYRNATGTRPGEGSGHHAATPPDVLQTFRGELGVEMECFASPLNCHFPHFCSAFVDTDVFFGSVGSFFDYYPVEGSFEAGPPYVEELMEEMRVHICSLLRNSSRPLSFCIVIPEWRTVPTPVIQNMDANVEGFVRRMIVVPLDQHVYVDGFQHCLRDSYFKPVHNTLVVIMQNDAGAKKWPASEEVEKRILSVWASVAHNIQDNPLFTSTDKKRERDGELDKTN